MYRQKKSYEIYTMKKTTKISSTTFVLCVPFVLVIFGIALLIFWPVILDKITAIIFTLSPNTRTFHLWSRNPIPIKMQVYMFNWTNPQDVYNSTRKLHFQEMGPYQFDEVKEKVNISWNPNGTITFKHRRNWTMDDNENVYQDEVTTINPIVLSAAFVVRNWSYLLRKGFSISLNALTSHLYVKKTVSQMLFEGYEDPLITLGQSMPMVHSVPKWDRFGWFYTRNGSEDFDGVFNMGTGQGGTTFGRLYNWNYVNQTDFYEGKCGEIFGSAGEFFPSSKSMGMVPNKRLQFFVPEMCRSISLDYEGQAIVQNIVGEKYSAGPSFLDNGTLLLENKCVCTSECQPYGLVNISSCRYGTPSFVSLPHFFKADPYYLEKIKGVQPNASKHDLYIIIEPTTGIPLEVSVRIQINLLLQPIPGVFLTDNVPKVYIPMLWLEEVVQIPAIMAFQLKLFLNFPAICTVTATLLILSSFVLMILIGYKMCTTNLCGKSRRKMGKVYETVPLGHKK